MLIFAIASFPVLIIMLYIYYRDGRDKEPLQLLLSAFAGGFLAVITTLVFASVPSYIGKYIGNPLVSGFFDAFFVAAIPEEASKFFFLYIFIFNKKEFNEYYDGIVYAVCVSLGFAFIENLMYSFSNGAGVAFLRMFTAVPAHAIFGVIMGYYFGKSRFTIEPSLRFNLQAKGLLLAILAHGLYDFPLMFSNKLNQSNAWSYLAIILFYVLLIYLYRLTFKKINELNRLDGEHIK